MKLDWHQHSSRRVKQFLYVGECRQVAWRLLKGAAHYSGVVFFSWGKLRSSLPYISKAEDERWTTWCSCTWDHGILPSKGVDARRNFYWVDETFCAMCVWNLRKNILFLFLLDEHSSHTKYHCSNWYRTWKLNVNTVLSATLHA